MSENPSGNPDVPAPGTAADRAVAHESAAPAKPAPPRPDRRREHGSAPSPDPIGPANADAPRPNPRREPARSDAAPRALVIDDIEWVAYPSGKGAYGTGHWGLAGVEAVHFARADAPEKPLLEALLASGRFSDLYDQELLALFRTAREIVIPEPGSLPTPRRFSLEEGRS